MANERSVEYLDKLSVQLARLVLVAAYYEDELTIAIGAALALNAIQCNALVRPLNIRAKLDLCNRLMAGAGEDDQKTVQKHCRRVRKLFEQRNSLIHGTFGHDAEHKVTVRSYTGKAKLTGRAERWSDQRVSDLAECILTMKGQTEGLSCLLTKALQAHETRGR